MVAGFASAEGTARFRARFAALEGAGFYRRAQSWEVSSLGLGTYLGKADEETDRAYTGAAAAALDGGINLLDSAINYRHQLSERALGRALEGRARDEIVVCSKAGFLVPGALPAGLRPEDVAGGIHSMEPRFLADQLERSRANLNLETIDVYYLHNPETQLNFVTRAEFDRRLAAAFEALEGAAAQRKIQYYGTASWQGYRQPAGAADALSLARVEGIAREVAGAAHRFRFVQLPYNLAMPEAFLGDALNVAAQLGITVVTSAALLQARLARSREDTAAAIQFARSAPGVTAALVGMSSPAHVAENLEAMRQPPIPPERYAELFEPDRP